MTYKHTHTCTSALISKRKLFHYDWLDFQRNHRLVGDRYVNTFTNQGAGKAWLRVTRQGTSLGWKLTKAQPRAKGPKEFFNPTKRGPSRPKKGNQPQGNSTNPNQGNLLLGPKTKAKGFNPGLKLGTPLNGRTITNGDGINTPSPIVNPSSASHSICLLLHHQIHLEGQVISPGNYHE